MKDKPLVVLIIVLLISACGGNKTETTETPTTTADVRIHAEGSETIGTPTAEAKVMPAEEQAHFTAQAAATYTPYPTHTPQPTYTPYPTYTAAARAATDTAVEMVSASPIPTMTPLVTKTAESTEIPTGAPARSPTPMVYVSTPAAVAAPSVELTRLEDTDPGPPFTVLVSRIGVKDSDRYKVTGIVRNDGSEIYEGIAVIGTLFDENGNPHGPVKVSTACRFLEPAAQCPFSLEIYGRNYIEYHLHPVGRPVEYRRPAPLLLSGVNTSQDGIGHVRVTGTAINNNPFTVENASIGGALVDAGGRIVSVGSAVLHGEIEPGAGRPFDLRIEYGPYSRLDLYVQATQN